MKKSIVLVLLFFSLKLFAQNLQVTVGGVMQGFSESYSNSPPITPGIFLEVESLLKPKTAIYGRSEFLFRSKLAGVNTYDKITGYSLSAGVKWFTKEEMQGFFIGPELSYSAINEKIKNDEVIFPNPNRRLPESLFAIGLHLGLQTKVNDRLSFSIFSSFGLGSNADLDEPTARYNLGAGIGYRL